MDDFAWCVAPCFYLKHFFVRYLHRDVDPWFRSIINQVIEKRDRTHERRDDFLQAVLDMRDRSNYDETTVMGQSLSFLTDGYETSSGIMAYCFYQVQLLREQGFIKILYFFIAFSQSRSTSESNKRS